MQITESVKFRPTSDMSVILGGPKNRTCLNVDNSAMVTRRKACDMSKVLECCRKKISYESSNIHVKSMFYSQIWQNFG